MINTNESDVDTRVTLESDKNGVIEEPPFHMIVLGDWRRDAGAAPIDQRKPLEIDRDNFDEVMARLGTLVRVPVGDSFFEIDLRSIDDLHPDNIVAKVELFAELRQLRDRLCDPASFYAASREVRNELNADVSTKPIDTPDLSKPPQVSGGLLDAILDKPEGGGTAGKAASSDIQSLVADLVRPHLVSVDESEQSKTVAAVDEAISDLLRQVLHSQSFSDAEAAWRGLFFLVRNVETSTDLKIYIFDISHDELLADLKENDDLSHSATARAILSCETDDPFSLVCGNFAFSPNVDDIAALMRIGKIAEASGAPFVSHMRPDVFGVRSISDQPDPREWKVEPESKESKLWTALRSVPEAKNLGMVIPRFLARLPYGSETDPTETFSFEEFSDVLDHPAYVWANGCFVAARLLAESFSSYGWEMGRSLKQDVERLPVHVHSVGGQTVYKPCAEALLSENACRELIECGMIPLASFKNTDRIRLVRYQSVAPGKTLSGRWG